MGASQNRRHDAFRVRCKSPFVTHRSSQANATQRKCFRRYSYIYDVESKTRKQYCDTEWVEATSWFVNYIDQCWTLECGSDPWVTQDLVNCKSKCELLSIRSHQLIFAKLVTGGSKISAADGVAKMAEVDEKQMPCWWTSSLISIFWRI